MLLAAYELAVKERLVYPFGAAISIAVLTFVPAEVFFTTMLLARNVADAYAYKYLPVAGGMNAGALVGVLVVGAGCLRLVGVGRQRIDGLGFALMLLVLLSFWTVIGYENFGSADGSITREFIRSASIIVLALVASVSVRRFEDVDRIVAPVVFAAAVPATIAIVQWVSSGHVTTRTSGTLAHPNAAAGLFGVALAAALWKLLERRSAPYVVAAVILAIGILATRSLGGLAQILVTLLVYSIATRQGGARTAVAAAAGVVIVGVFVLTPIGKDRVAEVETTRSFSAAAQGYQTNSLDWRFGNWAKLIEAWRQRPLLGYGSGTTETLVVPGQNIPHSDVIRLIVETGVIGFVIFGAAFVALLVALYRRARAHWEGASFGAAVLAIVCGLAVHGLVNNVSTQTATMYALAVLLGGLFGLVRGTQDPHPRRPGSPPVRLVP
jgi:O-antigen ligase